ncbi:S-layer homology domain-containing protein [Saccharibacillus sp. JS10]|uniref:S-layer homology domain-containing protein n=1 Tax=Saccharibacillus sp. JS10 TaxID=2950552 RepID=UPI00210A0060|nr:S-layer homology domain-containing protein [Saccharibacillus sp. JS10]MCQ4088481.1 S-layer homology domain-containing protein [Saccharibacillus sp. JS10]
MNRSWKKWVGTLVIGVVMVGAAAGGSRSLPSTEAAGIQFSDVKSSHWASSAVQTAVAKGYVDGYTNGTFKPESSVSRAEFVKMIVAAMKLEVPTIGGKWYAGYVKAATGAGLYAPSDFANNDAGWNKTMTREEMARVAARAVGEKTSEDDKWMYLATKAGLIKGVGKGALAPSGLTTRAQSVVIIERILTTNEGGKLDSDRYAVGAAEILWHGTNIFTVMPEMLVTPDSDWKGKGKSSIEEMWNEKNMTITSKDGLYQGKLEALIAIDLADVNDPNRGLLGNVNELKWFNSDPTNKSLFIKDQKNSYVVYFKGKPVYNKDTKKYNNTKYLRYNILGFDTPDFDEFYKKGKMNKVAHVYLEDSGDFPAMIIPKRGSIQATDIQILLNTPASGSLRTEVELLKIRGTR